MTTTLSGSLSEFRLADVLALLAMGGRTARMQITSPSGAGCVDLVEGQVSGATADATRAGLLRQVLGASPVPADDLAAALQSAHPVFALVEAGVVDGGLARDVAAEHCVDAVGDMLGWVEGEFAVSMGDLRAGDLGVRLDVDRLVADARTRVEEWELVHGMLPESGAVLRLTPDLSMAPMLGVEDWAILARIDGRRTLAEVVAAAGAAQLAASGRLAELMDRGLVQVRTEDADSERELVAALLDRFEGRVPAVVRAAAVEVAVVALEEAPEDAVAGVVADAGSGADEPERASRASDGAGEPVAEASELADEARQGQYPVTDLVAALEPVLDEPAAEEPVVGWTLAEDDVTVGEPVLVEPAAAVADALMTGVPVASVAGAEPVADADADAGPVADVEVAPVVALAEPAELPSTSFSMTASPRVAAAVFEAVALVSEPEPTFDRAPARGEAEGFDAFDHRAEPAVDVVPVFDVAVHDTPTTEVAWSPWAQALGLGEPSEAAVPAVGATPAPHGEDLLAGPGLGQYLAGAAEQATAPVPAAPSASWAAEAPAEAYGLALPTPREPDAVEGAGQTVAPVPALDPQAAEVPAAVTRPAGAETGDLPAGLLSHLIASVRGL